MRSKLSLVVPHDATNNFFEFSLVAKSCFCRIRVFERGPSTKRLKSRIVFRALRLAAEASSVESFDRCKESRAEYPPRPIPGVVPMVFA